MAIIKSSCFALALTALLSPVAMGQTSLNYDQCKRVTDLRDKDNNNNNQDQSFSTNREGSQRRTYGNLCTGSTIYSTLTGTTSSQTGTGDIPSRIGDPFRRFCDLIDKYPNVYSLMATGNSPHTVFAPTDAAFAKIDGLLSRLDEQRVLELHILPQARLTNDLRCGQTYRTLNTQQDRRSNQRSKTRCINAARAQQIGPGNTRNGLSPTIGVPDNIFNAQQYEYQTEFVLNFDSASSSDTTKYTFSQDVIACNGVIHVVDEVLIPGPQGFNGIGSGIGGGIRDNSNYYRSKGAAQYYGSQYYGSKGSSSSGYYYGAGSNTGPANLPAPSDYYGYRASSYYSYYGKSAKKAKKAKKGKGMKARPELYNGNNRNRNAYYSSSYGPLRKLNVEAKAAADEESVVVVEEPDEMFMTDAEFFGTEGLIEDASEVGESDLDNRKRRLEAMLEPDGKITTSA
eukprot:jgi/Psemu1/292837/fgenesh1_pg.1370_\